MTLATTRDRGASGERYGQTGDAGGSRIPFEADRAMTVASPARAPMPRAQAQLELDRARFSRNATLPAHRRCSTPSWPPERRATLARETRGFFEKSFRVGETDLPTRLRIELRLPRPNASPPAVRIELAAAISAWRRRWGLLPQ